MTKNLIKELNWQKVNGLLPVVIQDAKTSRVLMLGYMNEESFKKTLKTKKVWFFSRTKQRLWQKGEKSGNFLKVIEVFPDCDNDTLLIRVEPVGPVCHTGKVDCFDSGDDWNGVQAFACLYELICERKKLLPSNSYTASLFKEGLNKICAKIGEESGEVIKAATKETKRRLVSESVDLMYHLFVACVEKQVELNDLTDEIQKRRKMN